MDEPTIQSSSQAAADFFWKKNIPYQAAWQVCCVCNDVLNDRPVTSWLAGWDNAFKKLITPLRALLEISSSMRMTLARNVQTCVICTTRQRQIFQPIDLDP